MNIQGEATPPRSKQDDNPQLSELEWNASETTTTAWSSLRHGLTRTRTLRNCFGGGSTGVSRRALQQRRKPASFQMQCNNLSASDLEYCASPATTGRHRRAFTVDVAPPPPEDDTDENAWRVNTRRSFHRSNSVGSVPSRQWMDRNSYRDSSTSSSNTSEELFACDTATNVLGRERKKIRARRASIQGTIAPLSTFALRHQSSQYRQKLERPPSISHVLNELSGDDLSSPARSVASRKRSVDGSPHLSSDEMSVSRNSSSSRSARQMRPVLSSPSCGLQMLFDLPSLAVDVRPRCMDLDDTNECESSRESASDTSFDDESLSSPLPTGLTSPEGQSRLETARDIVDSAPSSQDIEFLANALRKEKRSRFFFGELGTWRVIPRVRWSFTRRQNFLQWAARLPGLSLCEGGGSVNNRFLKISKRMGTELLEKLGDALGMLNVVESSDNAPLQLQPQFLEINCSSRKSRSASSFIGLRPEVSVTRSSSTVADGLSRQMEALTMDDDASHAKTRSNIFVEKSVAMSQLTNPSFESDDEEVVQPISDVLPVARTSVGTGRSKCNRASIGAASSFDLFQTPLTVQDDKWGSRPVEGQDWGDSSRCSRSLLENLELQLAKSLRAAGKSDSLDGTQGTRERCGFGSCLRFDAETKEDSNNFELARAEGSPTSLASAEESAVESRLVARHRKSMMKHRRMSLAASVSSVNSLFLSRCSADVVSHRSNGALASASELPLQLSEGVSREVEPIKQIEENPERMSNATDHSCNIATLAPALLANIFSFLTEHELLRNASRVCCAWADAATSAHAQMMFVAVEEVSDDEGAKVTMNSVAQAMQRPWADLIGRFPWGMYLGDGGMKKVYKVYNLAAQAEEAISVMNVDEIDNPRILGAELAVSAMLSSLTRRGICPNFILTREVFTCEYDAPEKLWGSRDNRRPQGNCYKPKKRGRRKILKPDESTFGKYQFIRMECCEEGDAEEFIKRQPNAMLSPRLAQCLLFQMAFALYAASVQFSVKHYDVKLLNIFIKRAQGFAGGRLVLRYCLGDHVFFLPMEQPLVAKLADYGTANVSAASNGQPVTQAQFTTLENTPADFMLLGDQALQGHGHDQFGLGLCMLHLFTGSKPYEELLEDVRCPPTLKKRLKVVWESGCERGTYSVIRSIILADVHEDEGGNIVEGEPDETFYDTLYRFLVLFDVPDAKHKQRECPQVWNAIVESLGDKHGDSRAKRPPDASQFARDRNQFSLSHGRNEYIARARETLTEMDGGMELLFSLCSFDPERRASALDVMNSKFMHSLRETECGSLCLPGDTVRSFTAFATG